ncbi:MAG: tryptophan synthase subunit alpha, partial [Candidatus Levyibacteriota bacterium]
KVKDAFIIMSKLSKEVAIPLLFMCYYNTVFVYGVEKFCKDAANAGATGLIVPDIPLDEESEEHFLFYCKKYNLHAIRVISPASTKDRLEKNANVASGFVYFTSRQGTTGASTDLDPQLVENLAKVQKYIIQPIAVGFGISKKEHVQALQGHAAIAVVGSAILNVINSSKKENREKDVARFIRKLMLQ